MKKSSLTIAILLFISIISLLIFFLKKYIKLEEKNAFEYDNEIQLMAVAYLNDVSEIMSKYGFENIKTYQLSGDYYYLFIPRYGDIQIKVYEAVLDNDNIVKGNFLFDTNLPFVISCDRLMNSSNVILEIKYNDISFEYSPSFNSENNSININEYILDITK